MKTRLKQLRRFLIAIPFAALAVGGVLAWSNYECLRAARNRMFRTVESVPANDVAHLLGTARTTL
ncbi:MAG: hypothetical protein NTZ98_21030, partial [Acidobacteria bacterium]|nr:hypothetical protein [Acidobacteriota bacterium]